MTWTSTRHTGRPAFSSDQQSGY